MKNYEVYEKPIIELVEFSLVESITMSGNSALGPDLVCVIESYE